MNKVLRVLVALPGIFFVVMGLRWLVDPARLFNGNGTAPFSSGVASRTEFFEAEVEVVPSDHGTAAETEALARTAVSQFDSYVKLNKKVPQEVLASVGQITDPSKLADTIAAHLERHERELERLGAPILAPEQDGPRHRCLPAGRPAAAPLRAGDLSEHSTAGQRALQLTEPAALRV